VLSRLAREVVSVERYRTLADVARKRLAALGYGNVAVVTGDGFTGVSDLAPYDRHHRHGGGRAIPQALVDQLADGGVMCCRSGRTGGTQRIVPARQDQGWDRARGSHRGVRFVPLLPGQAREL